MAFNPLFLLYATPLLALWTGWTLVNRRRTIALKAIIADNMQAGLNEPQSLHPVIDPTLCLGCAACVRACPEHDILGIIDGKAVLVEPTLCVGHGACATSCPTKAISLVFGTETRGVDIPLLSPQFETNVPGIYIAGELGGMGLIKNAIEQGRQAAAHAAAKAGTIEGGQGILDVVIVGCGPAGISASLGVMEKNLKFLTIDQATLGGTVAHFPRGKLVMTSPATLPIIGQVRFGEVSKERLLAFWEEVLSRTGLKPRFEEQVTAITRAGPHFDVATSKGTYRTKTVILAIGRRGTPRPLEVPGEDLEKVVYRLIDPEQYVGRKVLVVGGGDSALEAAARIAEQSDTHVTLAYRGNAYSRARAKNRDRVAELAATGRMSQLMGTSVRHIRAESVELNCKGETRQIANDDVIVCAGGLLPTQFLHDTGISVETKYGTV